MHKAVEGTNSFSTFKGKNTIMMTFKNILTNILSGLYTGFFESLLLAFFFMFFYLTAKKVGGFKVAIQGLFTKFKASKD